LERISSKKGWEIASLCSDESLTRILYYIMSSSILKNAISRCRSLTVWVKSLLLGRSCIFSVWLWLRCWSITERIDQSVFKKPG
jgi:hypothetical protein